MSDAGLYGSIYEQLRRYADRFDRALVRLKSHDNRVAATARRELVDLLRDVTKTDTEKPSARLLAIILRQELSRVYGEGLGVCESLAASLDRGMPSEDDLTRLEQIASTVDRECSDAMARLRGRI